MFGIVADLLAGIITILFPVFASYKALRAEDPTQLTPWLMYWVVYSLILLAESWTIFILGWVPFYSWIRLFLLSYLVLPQTQGAKLLYINYISPFLATHEHDIEVFISNAHERAASVGLSYLKKLIDLIREKVLGLPAPASAQAAPPPQQGYSSAAASYSANLLSRFSMPSAAAKMPGYTSPSDLYSLLTSAVSATAAATSSKSTTARGADATPLVPENLSSPTEKLSFIATQREKLTYLLTALDRAQSSLTTNPTSEKEIEADIDSRMRSLDPTIAGLETGSLKKNRNKSEHSFENIDRDDLESSGQDSPIKQDHPVGPTKARRTMSGGWIPTTWFGGDSSGDRAVSSENKSVEGDGEGKSSGFDATR